MTDFNKTKYHESLVSISDKELDALVFCLITLKCYEKAVTDIPITRMHREQMEIFKLLVSRLERDLHDSERV